MITKIKKDTELNEYVSKEKERIKSFDVTNIRTCQSKISPSCVGTSEGITSKKELVIKFYNKTLCKRCHYHMNREKISNECDLYYWKKKKDLIDSGNYIKQERKRVLSVEHVFIKLCRTYEASILSVPNVEELNKKLIEYLQGKIIKV